VDHFAHLLYPDLNGFKGWMDKKMIFNGLEANCFHKYFALTFYRKMVQILHRLFRVNSGSDVN